MSYSARISEISKFGKHQGSQATGIKRAIGGSTESVSTEIAKFEQHHGKMRRIGITEGSKEEFFDYFWMVKNVSTIPSSDTQSPEFQGGDLSNHKWKLQLSTNYQVGENSPWICIYLLWKDFGPHYPHDSVAPLFCISMFMNGMTITRSSDQKDITTLLSNEVEKFGIGLKMVEKPMTFTNDSVKIHCKIWLKNPEVKSTIYRSPNPYSPLEENSEKFHTDFATLLHSGENSDFEILVDEKTLKAHKLILAARSTVFLSLFATIKTESSVLIMSGYDHDTVEKMLQYIYTGKTDISSENVFSLLKVSNNYRLPDLRAECEDHLIKGLNFQNVFTVFDFADQMKGPTNMLKAKVVEFIIRNKGEMAKTKEFNEVIRKNASLSAELLKAEWKV